MKNEKVLEFLRKALYDADEYEEQCRIRYSLAAVQTRWLRAEIEKIEYDETRQVKRDA